MSQSGETSVDLSALKQELDARFRAPLMAYFLRRTGNRSEAEDLTQDTFVRLIGSASFAMADEANAYVFRVASNLLRDRARTAARWKKFPMSPLDMDVIEEINHGFSEDRSPERVLIGRENLLEALNCLDELGEQAKNIFILFRLHGMKQKDIAAFYGIGLSTVEKQVMLGVLHLARRFGAESL